MEIVRIRDLKIVLLAILLTDGTSDNTFTGSGYIKTTPVIAVKENQKPISCINDGFKISKRINEMHNSLGLFDWRFHCTATAADIIHIEARSTLALSPSK